MAYVLRVRKSANADPSISSPGVRWVSSAPLMISFKTFTATGVERRQLFRDLTNGYFPFLGGHDTGDQTPVSGHGSRDRSGPHQHVLGPEGTDGTHQPLGPATSGDHVQLDLGKGELTRVGGDDEVTSQGELQSNAQTVSADGCDHRLAAAARSRHVRVKSLEVLQILGQEFIEITARAERLITRSPQDDHLDRRIGAELPDCGAQASAHIEAELVSRRAAVDDHSSQPMLSIDAHLTLSLVGCHAGAASFDFRLFLSTLPIAFLGSEVTIWKSFGRL